MQRTGAVGPARAGAWTGHAVIVGIAEYQDHSLDTFFLDDDATRLRDLLLRDGAHRSGGNVVCLTDDAASKSAIQTAIAAMGAAAGANDVCLFYIATHGGHGPGLAPADECDGQDEHLTAWDSTSMATTHIRDDELDTWFSGLVCENIWGVLPQRRGSGTYLAAHACRMPTAHRPDHGFRLRATTLGVVCG